MRRRFLEVGYVELMSGSEEPGGGCCRKLGHQYVQAAEVVSGRLTRRIILFDGEV